MKHLKNRIASRMCDDLLNTHYNNLKKQKDNIMATSSLDIICASEVEEFFYEETDEVVPEGLPVGIEVETPKGVELVLFSNIYHQSSWANF
jgi:hypothetical protein